MNTGSANRSPDQPRPPAKIDHVGGNVAYARIGQKFLNYFVSQCGLHPSWSVLDVGCGVGRIVVPLAGYLAPRARYEGFDLVPEGIAWCKENVTARHSNFRFELVDIQNSRYNPAGTLRPSEFVFPYEAEQFDFVVLVSVFTHMLLDDVEHYVSEIRRVTKPGGQCIATFFLLNDESLALTMSGKNPMSGKNRLRFQHDYGNYRVQRAELPEAVVAYREEYVIDLLHRHGFEAKIDYGRWLGLQRSVTNNVFQDVVVAALNGGSAESDVSRSRR